MMGKKTDLEKELLRELEDQATQGGKDVSKMLAMLIKQALESKTSAD
jgi:hypothetical protein